MEKHRLLIHLLQQPAISNHNNGNDGNVESPIEKRGRNSVMIKDNNDHDNDDNEKSFKGGAFETFFDAVMVTPCKDF